MSVQDILLQQAMLDNKNQPDPAVAMGVGGTGGALLGMMAGRGLRGRMAGGLLGAITSGALGGGLAKAMETSSPAGEMLAKIQANGGELDTMDKMKLQQILTDVYGSM